MKTYEVYTQSSNFLLNTSDNPDAAILVQSNKNCIFLNPASEKEVITMFHLLKVIIVSDVDDI